MGIQGLLPLLKDVHEHVNLGQLSGKTYAIDGYVWLHKGAFTCAPQLVRGEKTVKYVDYAMTRIRLLRHHNVEPYVVFDGGLLPAKQGTETNRKQKREENLALANSLHAQGKHSEARDYYAKCVDVTPEMAYQFIKALKVENVRYVVAPYEADAQLAYLERTGIVDGILTEDSDLLVFGCRDVLYKMDSDGACVRIRKERLTACREMNFVGWGDKEFRWMAMLSGCDYLPSIPGMGLKTSYKLLRRHRTVDRVLQAVRMEGTLKVPQGYQKAFETAELAFIYQRVYCPLSQKLVHLNERTEDLEWDESKEAYVGSDMDSTLARGIAEGDICPVTREPLKDISPWYAPKKTKPTATKPVLGDVTNKRTSTVGTNNSIGMLTSYFTRIPKASGEKPKRARPELASNCRAGGSGKRTLAEDGEEARMRKKARARDDKENQPATAFGMSKATTAQDVSKELDLDLPTEETGETVSRFFDDVPMDRPGTPASISDVASDAGNCGEEPADMEVAMAELPTPLPPVEQEDGYLSPLPPSSPSAVSESDLSSPVKPSTVVPTYVDDGEARMDDSIDVSSPTSPDYAERRRKNWGALEELFMDTPTRRSTRPGASQAMVAPALVRVYSTSSEIDEDWPLTPEDSMDLGRAGKSKKGRRKTELAALTTAEVDVEAELEIKDRQKKVSSGWWARYSLGSSDQETPPTALSQRVTSLSQGVPSVSKSSRSRIERRASAPLHFPSQPAIPMKVATREEAAEKDNDKTVDVEDMLQRSRSRLMRFSRVG